MDWLTRAMAIAAPARLRFFVLVLLTVVILTLGCGGGDDGAITDPTASPATPTSTASPDTASPAPTSTPETVPDPTPTATSQPAPTPEPTPTATPEPVPVDELAWEWLPSPANGIPLDVGITGLFRVDDRLLATGEIENIGGVMFLSDDGVTWEPASDGAFGGHSPVAVAAGGPGLVAVGTEILFDANGDQVNDAIVWVSADGRDWERVTDPDLTGPGRQEVFTVIATQVGLIASGWGIDDFSARDEDFMVWLSTDGRDWERVTMGLQAAGQQRVGLDPEINRHSIAARDTIVIVGRQQLPGAPNLSPAIWVSNDGTTWEPATGAPLSEQGELNSISANDNLFVAVGSDGKDALVLISSDGRTWERVAQDSLDASGTQRMSGIERSGEGFIALGYTQPTNEQAFPAVWHSPDGRRWESLDQATTTPAPSANLRLAYIVKTPTGIIIMGQSSDPHVLIGQPR